MSTMLAGGLAVVGATFLPVAVAYPIFRIADAVTRPRQPIPGGDPSAAPISHPVGRAPRALAALAYALGPLSGAVLLGLVRRDRFVRFHAAQSVLTGLLQAAVAYVVFFVLLLLAMLPPRGWLVAAGLAALFAAGSLVQWLAMLARAARGITWRDPLLGDRAWRYAAERPPVRVTAGLPGSVRLSV